MRRVFTLAALVFFSQSVLAAQSGTISMTSYRKQVGKSFEVRVTGSTSGRIWGGSGNVYTDDSSIAAAAVHAGLLRAGQTGTIIVTVLPGQTSYPALTRNGVTSNQYGKWQGSFRLSAASAQPSAQPASQPSSTASPNRQPSTGSVAISAPVNMASYRGQNGKSYVMRVTGSTSGRVWGGSGNVYTDDSIIAVAAVHAGLLRVGQTGTVTVTVLPGQASYPALTRNGVTSNRYGTWRGSYRLSAASGQPSSGPAPTSDSQSSSSANTATQTASSVDKDMKDARPAPETVRKYRGHNGSLLKFRVRGVKSDRVWGGTDCYYTDDSDLAAAALHAGAVPLGEWGVVKVVIRPGRSNFWGFPRNGINSKNYGEYSGSFQIVNCKNSVPTPSGKVPGSTSSPSAQPASTPSLTAPQNGRPSAPSAGSAVIAAPGNMVSYRGQNGKSYVMRVTGSTSGRLWGGSGNVYTDDSSIAAAAVHAGLLRAGQTGTITVTVLPGQTSYPTLTRNGVTSTQYGKWHGSYRLSR